MEHQQELKQEFDASSESASTSTMTPERFSCLECSARHDPKRQWLLATSILLNLMFAMASITVLIVLLAPLSSSSFTANPSDSSPSTSIHQNITTPHAHARRQSPITTCLLGITEADMYTFIDYVGSKSYPGKTCQQVNQEGLVPYQYGALYEVAVAPVGFTRTRDIDKRSDSPNVNDEFGPGHAHWHPETDEERRKIDDRTGRWPFHFDVLVLVSGTQLHFLCTPPPAPVTTGHLRFHSLHKRSGLTPSYAIRNGVLVALSVILALVFSVYGGKFVGKRPRATMG